MPQMSNAECAVDNSVEDDDNIDAHHLAAVWRELGCGHERATDRQRVSYLNL